MKVWCARCASYRSHFLNRIRHPYGGEWQCEDCGNVKKTPKGYTPLGSQARLTGSESRLLVGLLSDALMGLDDDRAQAEHLGDRRAAAALGRTWSNLNTIIDKLSEAR